MDAFPKSEASRWPVLSPLLDELLELDGEARARRLAELSLANPPMAAELSDLLARQEVVQRSAFLEGPALGEVEGATLEGRTVGAYTIERALGQGGMGTVWLARRSDGRFDGYAAVKFPRLALMGSGGAARFRLEGNALARLSHPNIAHLLDAGVAEGQPYLLLEHVEGERIDEWSDARALGVEARLRLFLHVLDAVAHAHDRLVLHRDLKPSNILVTAQGQPKLLDFGVAKLLESRPASVEVPNLTGQLGRPYTPGYAAPEQLQGGDVTTATDVYALGVVLFRLLAGVAPVAHPATSATGRPAPAVAGRGTRASLAAARAPPQVAGRRGGATPAELSRALRGDLDNVLGKALEEDPGRRYPTVHALADDLRRHLAHEPVAARAGTFAYRLGRAVRRHRLAFGAAALVALALLAGVAGTTWEAVEAGRQRSQAIGERGRADREAQRAREQRDFALRQASRAQAVAELDDFLIFEAAPNGKPFTAVDLLARAERVVSKQEPATDPNRVALLVAIGRHYGALEDLTRSRRLLDEAYRLSRDVDDPVTRAEAACGLASTLGKTGEGARAEELVQAALASLPDEPQFALARVDCLRTGAGVAGDAGDPAAAVDRARAAAGLVARLGFPAGFLDARVAMDTAEAYRVAGRLPEAAAAWKRAEELLAAAGRDDTETAGTALNNLGITLLQLGRPLEAEALFRRSLRIDAVAGGAQRTSPTLLGNLARALTELDRLPEAARLTRQALSLAHRSQQEVAVNQMLLLRTLLDLKMGDLAGSAKTLSEVEPRLRRMLPAGHYAFAALETYRSMLAEARGDLGAAGAAADRAISMARASGQGPWLLSYLLTHRAELELQTGRLEEARRDAGGAVEQWKALVGETAPARQLGLALLARGRALRGLGDADGARKDFESAAEQLRACLGPDHPQTRTAERLAAGGAR